MGGVIRSHSLPLIVAIAAFGMSTPAAAEFRVLESNAEKYPVGAVFPNDERFELGEGCVVRVLVLPTNETRIFEGKKSHRLAPGGTRDLSRPESCE
jgi:hypothetical protein